MIKLFRVRSQNYKKTECVFEIVCIFAIIFLRNRGSFI